MNTHPPAGDAQFSPDHDDRIADFLSRHGGPGERPRREGQSAPGLKGWTEVYARDGYALRCDWSRIGSLHEMRYAELAPGERAIP